MAKVILICGKICSGKTYYANMIKEKENAVILSVDEVTYDLINNEQGKNYDNFTSRVKLYLIKKSVELVQVGCNVILDWGFWTRLERQKITEYYKSKNIQVEWHYIDIDDNSWHRNIEERNNKVLAGKGEEAFYVDDGLLNKLLASFEAPAQDEIDIIYKVS